MEKQSLEISLDQLLAFDIPKPNNTFEQERQNLEINIQLFLAEIKPGTSLETDIKPALFKFRRWLREFEKNMTTEQMRLQGALKMRVCYAEFGMEILISLIEAYEKETIILQKAKQFKLLDKLKLMIQNILGKPMEGHVSLMFVWLKLLQLFVPITYKSNLSSLNSNNVKKLQSFIK